MTPGPWLGWKLKWGGGTPRVGAPRLLITHCGAVIGRAECPLPEVCTQFEAVSREGIGAVHLLMIR